MIVFPRAKINLGLRITGLRPDGYHNIETVFYPVSLSDALELVISDETYKPDILTVTGIDTGIVAEENIIMKTLGKLRKKYMFPLLKIHLHKAIPVGAGLGGGSSDAACFIKSINRRFCLDINEIELKDLALEVGSDCPFFIDFIPSFASGRGEKLIPIKPVLAGYYMILLNPGIEINTREAYNSSKPGQPSSSLFQLVNLPVSDWKNVIINDFEDFAFSKHTLIRDIKEELYSSGALFSSMSGSGSSVYGIFTDPPALPEKLKNFVIYKGFI